MAHSPEVTVCLCVGYSPGFTWRRKYEIKDYDYDCDFIKGLGMLYVENIHIYFIKELGMFYMKRKHSSYVQVYCSESRIVKVVFYLYFLLDYF